MTKWTNRVPWTVGNYVLRVTEEGFGPSKASENPMITLNYEVASPESVEIAGEPVLVAGTKITGYYTTIVLNGEGDLADKTEKAQARVKELYELFGLKSDNINFENPVLEFKGKLVHARLYCDTQERRDPPTKEQLAKGQKQGNVAVNPVTGKPLIAYYPKIEQVFGLATEDANKPY